VNPDLARALFFAVFAAFCWFLESGRTRRASGGRDASAPEAFDRDSPTYDWEDPL